MGGGGVSGISQEATCEERGWHSGVALGSRLTTGEVVGVGADTVVSNLLKNRFNSLALFLPPSAPLLLVGLNPVMVFMPLHTSLMLFCWTFGAVLQGSLFGMAGLLPASYTTPIMSGQGLAGTFAAFAMICAIASGSELQDAAFGYFITACVVIFLSILSYILLPKLVRCPFIPSPRPEIQNMEHKHIMHHSDQKKPQDVSMLKIFKKIWILALSVCFTFTVTIGTFPAVTADTKSTLSDGGSWDQYFIPVSCFLLFNLCDWGGRSLTAILMWPGKDSVILPASIGCRLVFIPLFMLCNVHPRAHLPVVFHHDCFFILFMILFAFSNGYLASLCMCYGPRNVLPHEAETAGAIMAFFLSLGLALGAALSFLIRILV
uniref:Equilibrative nucleoside transporter 1-like n=1 Tax=Pundamilia nyererei TaxID=303518 RepID=A0A3B4GIA2_9CICH